MHYPTQSFQTLQGRYYHHFQSEVEKAQLGVAQGLALLVVVSGREPCSYLKLTPLLLSTVLSSRRAIGWSCWCCAVIIMVMAPEGGDCGQEDQLVISVVQTRDAMDMKKNRTREH